MVLEGISQARDCVAKLHWRTLFSVWGQLRPRRSISTSSSTQRYHHRASYCCLEIDISTRPSLSPLVIWYRLNGGAVAPALLLLQIHLLPAATDPSRYEALAFLPINFLMQAISSESFSYNLQQNVSTKAEQT